MTDIVKQIAEVESELRFYKRLNDIEPNRLISKLIKELEIKKGVLEGLE